MLFFPSTFKYKYTKPDPAKEEWSESMNRDVDEIAGGMMRFFGYIH